MRIIVAAVSCALLAGCSASQTVGSVFYLKPYKFEDLSCADLKQRAAAADGRIKDYQGLKDKAAQSTGGSALGAMVYMPDSQRAAWDQRLFAEEYTRRNCTDPPPPPPPPPAPPPAPPTSPPKAAVAPK